MIWSNGKNKALYYLIETNSKAKATLMLFEFSKITTRTGYTTPKEVYTSSADTNEKNKNDVEELEKYTCETGRISSTTRTRYTTLRGVYTSGADTYENTSDTTGLKTTIETEPETGIETA